MLFRSATDELARKYRRGFPGSLSGAPMLLPSGNTALRGSLDQWFDEEGIRPLVRAEFNDSALLKAFGGFGDGIFAAPTAVEEDVRRMYGVGIVGREESVRESFYAISVEKRLKHPAVVLHELAHAYHDQILSFDQPEILAAYQKAKAAGIYENVLLYTGKKVKHYGLTNHKEYFAEGTEAFFYRNDFYPFVRAELKEHDPILHDVLARVWGVVANPTAPSPAGTSPDLKSGSGK